MNLFNPENGIMKGLTKITDIICLSLLFVVSSIPIITIGTSCTALYYTIYKVIRHDRGYIFREYTTAFKENFKQTTPIWLVILGVLILLGLDIRIVNAYAEEGSKLGILAVFFLIAIVFLFAWSMYLFSYMARFENTRKQSMKNAALIAIANLPRTILLVLIGGVFAFGLYIIPVLILVIPGLFAFIQSFILEKIFWKYMSDEDRQKEEERNQEFKN